jgi:flagellar hook-basal body complex protein FliE
LREWSDSQSKPNSSFRKLLKEHIDKANPRRKLAKEETIKLAKLEGIVEKLRQSFFLQMSQDQQLKGDSQNY